MTIEEGLMRAAGLDPPKINSAMVEASALLGIIKGELPRVRLMMDNAQKLMDDVNHIIGVYEAQQAKLEKLLSDIQSQINAYQANQRRFGGGARA